MSLAIVAGASIAAIALQGAPMAFTNINPSWSPDGRRLVFQSERDREPGNVEIYVIGADGSGLRRLTTSPRQDTHPAWSPDGRWIAFDSNRSGRFHIYLMAADGSEVRRVTSEDHSGGRTGARHPSWSPDGRQLLFDSDMSGDEEIYAIAADGSGQRRLTSSPGNDGHAVWSPDGRTIASAPTATARPIARSI
jgi:TolB protein